MNLRKPGLLFAVVTLLLPHSEIAEAKKSAADQRLYEQARKECSGSFYPNGARIQINYAGGWFRCVEPHSHK